MAFELTDSHCHIHEANMAALEDSMWRDAADPDEMARSAAQNQVTRIICIGTTLADSQRAVNFAQSHQGCWAAVGIHPHESKDLAASLDGLRALATQQKVVAIGEIGLDYFYEHSSREQQIAALRAQLELAKEFNLPVSFHVRDALEDFWPIFDSFNGIRGVLHSFTGDQADCQKALERGLLIGVNGIITFTKNDWQLEIAKTLPLKKIVLETDAPFLTPKPLRGTLNVPANVRFVAEFLAQLRGDSLENIAKATTHNAQTLFALD